jgi:hypothetical protein
LSEGLRISRDLSLPLEAATWTFADLGIKDSGKTYDAGDLAEEFLKDGVPIIVLDGMGIWWGLRIGADKKGRPDPRKPGMPVVVFGGDHRDLPIPTRIERGREVVDTERLELMAKAILEAGISAVLDTSEFSKNMQRRIVAVFVNEVYHLNARYGVRHVFIEEADMWCMQKVVGDAAASVGAIDDLVRRGGNFNLGCTLISQRPAVVNKDVLTQASCLLIHRVVHDIDKKAVAAWVRSMVDPDDKKFKKWFDSLKGLDNGEAWVWRPQNPFPIFQKIKFRPRETVHASREFFRRPEAKTAKMGDVHEFIEKFQNVFSPKPRPIPHDPATILKADSSETLPTLPTNVPERHERANVPRQEPLVVRLTQPNISVHQTLALINVPLEPQSGMGRLLVVLFKNTDQAGNKRWTLSSMKDAVNSHGWEASEDELKAIIPTLLQTEHLIAVQSGNRTDYKFTGRNRVRILEEHPEITIA